MSRLDNAALLVTSPINNNRAWVEAPRANQAVPLVPRCDHSWRGHLKSVNTRNQGFRDSTGGIPDARVEALVLSTSDVQLKGQMCKELALQRIHFRACDATQFCPRRVAKWQILHELGRQHQAGEVQPMRIERGQQQPGRAHKQPLQVHSSGDIAAW
eukprot:CAMPEP_0114573774 /NCGR_PEP_ID=MMETSP0114-20121206/19044_1 /TAXON_ID=31324 /ORGANISM="Goniomonas sp, Strain m" /LENGTH=156 /DNA_ID=CAMNT_0001761153 /DNA_START=93 /DNA_END=563 /DNA_ORIENTATION=-